ncbi:hypothetical protein SVAN01_10433 [Stagonosporopsis vannaccii]|nr:hypothetical protein SVAN01_10433 [Stagonosporopsis vannaccii]
MSPHATLTLRSIRSPAWTPLPFPHNTELSESACRTIAKLSQRTATEIALLKSLWKSITQFMDNNASFFLRVPRSQYDRTPKTRAAILQDTGMLLTMPFDLARLVLYQVEGCIHKSAKNVLSDGQRSEVQALRNRLAIQHPDHVTNIIQLWGKVLDMKDDDVQDVTVQDLGMLWQHQSAETVVILGELEKHVGKVELRFIPSVAGEEDDEKKRDRAL